MADPFVGEIRIFGGKFAPRGWAFCDGRTLPIAQNQMLYAIIGTTYGGDGRSTLGLPDLSARVPMHSGSGPGLTPRELGEQGGVPEVVLQEEQMPAHTHTFNATYVRRGGTSDPTDNTVGSYAGNLFVTEPSSTVSMSGSSMKAAGSGGAHDNMQPYLALNFIICLDGIFPPRS